MNNDSYQRIFCLLDDDCLAEVGKHLSLEACLRSEGASKSWKSWLPCQRFKSVEIIEGIDSTDLHQRSSSIVVFPIKTDRLLAVRCLIDRIGGLNLSEIKFSRPNHLAVSMDVIREDVVSEIEQRALRLRRLAFNRVALDSMAVIAVGRLVQLEALSFISCVLESTSKTGGWTADDSLRTAFLGSWLNSALSSLTQLRELRIRPDPFLLSSLKAPSLRILDIVSGRANSEDIRSFIRSHPQLVELSIDSKWWVTKLPADNHQLVIDTVIDHCPQLKRLHLLCFRSDSILVDALKLRDLESIDFGFSFWEGLTDDDVIEICKHNPKLKKFNFAASRISVRAYTDGVARFLHRLEIFDLPWTIQLDDKTFEAVIFENTSSLREVCVHDQSLLTCASLCSLGFYCQALEKLCIHSFVYPRAPWCSPAALTEFAKSVAASPGRLANISEGCIGKVQVIVDTYSGDFVAGHGNSPTGVVIVRLSRDGAEFVF